MKDRNGNEHTVQCVNRDCSLPAVYEYFYDRTRELNRIEIFTGNSGFTRKHLCWEHGKRFEHGIDQYYLEG